MWHAYGTPCAGGVEYLHRSPASRRRRRKWKSRIWGNKIWSWYPRDSDPRMTALARTGNNCKGETRPFVRESAPHQQTRNCLTETKIWSWAPDGCFILRQTGRLTVGCNIRLRHRFERLETIPRFRQQWKILHRDSSDRRSEGVPCVSCYIQL
jgi:hypothetical protein